MNKKRQSIDASTEITQTLELFDENFKATVIKMLQRATTMFSKQMKTRKFWQRNRRHKEKPKGKFRTEKHNNQIKNPVDGSALEGEDRRISKLENRTK